MNSFNEINTFEITDWISSATFLQDPNEFILVTSHSVVLRMIYKEKFVGKNVCKIASKISCCDKSTLYCSYIHGKTFKELVVFGGNALGELLIWKPSKESTTSHHSVDCTHFEVDLLRRISCHNGVIFSIDYNDKFNILTTTSDDRSIRFWKREVKGENGWIDFNFIPTASGYGHAARVFQGKVIDSGGHPFVITVGEDSYACLWKANADLVFKKRLHFGAIIWNFEYDSNTCTLYTIGSTGNLLAYNLEHVIASNLHNSYEKALQNLDTMEYIAKAKFLKSNIVIGVTNKNRVLYTCIATNTSHNKYGPWHVLDMHKTFKCTVLQVHDNKYVVICGYKRLILLKCSEENKFEKLFDNDVMDGVIRAFHFLSEKIFLTSDDTGKCLFTVGESLELRIPVPLPHCKEPWTTAALHIQTHIEKDYLVLSNRMGNILLFYLEIKHKKCIHLDTIRQAHGRLGATMLRLQEISTDQVFLQSAGHDGSLRLYAITIETDSIQNCQRIPVPVAWIEHLIYFEYTEHLLGFNDNHFVVWSQQHDFSVQVPCGGGHRSWHYHITSDGDNKRKTFLQVLFIKNKEIIFHKTHLYNIPAIGSLQLFRNEWHTRPCNVLKTLELRHGEIPYTIIISAGDDNIIKITKLMTAKQLVHCAEVHTHISNVRALQVLQDHTNDLLIFSGGGRAQLCITRLNLTSYRLKELVNYTLNKSTPYKEGIMNSYRFDPETRIMSCDVAQINNDISNKAKGYLIFLCCSDGYLRKVHINQYFEVVAEYSKYYGCCLLQIRVFANLYVLTAGTDGILSFFDLNLVELPIRLSHHASGVNAMDILYESGTGVVHIITGGDDQSISYTSMQLRNDKILHILKEFHLANAHMAQVTAVQFCYNGKILCAYTSGLDQILNMVDIRTQKHHYICNTCVADTKGLVVDKLIRCFVYGCGIQIFRLQQK
ncbi:tRNA (34-2'-O)-methyltransferase regulator WDR6 isoform X2 [Eurosta solidaginis]|uniref:tRNA (34-2'-O)-methyltransferase regulator WDR6 isoform X2 n=1 Tax=Eurosta solidaginis TaxID=178769 RepID=UPI00353143C2